MELYQLPKCPYCAIVRDKLDELKVKYEIINIDRDNKPEIVMKHGGFVPVLVDNDLEIGDSKKILEYIVKKYKN